MSDAREIVQPRWKRRATEIAEAIGGNSTGVSSVSLDLNTITLLSEAIANEIALKTLNINIKAYDDDLVSSAGLPIRTGTAPVSGGFLPLRVVTDIGDKVDINVREFNDVSVDSRGLPVQAGRTTTTNALVPLVVNCPTVNNFPTGGSGGTTTFPSTMDVNIVKFGGGPNISASAHLPITGSVNCSQDTGSLRPWIVSTGVQGSNTLGQWGNTTLSVTETNPVSGGGGGGGTSLTQQQVETAMGNALANAIGISVTESSPVTAVKIVGDETYGIIMSKTYFNTANQHQDYDCRGMGLGAYAGYNMVQGIPNSQAAPTTDGWTIRCNGVDVPNQDITLGLRGTTPSPTPIQAGVSSPSFNASSQTHPLLIPIFDQEVLDKYSGRKVIPSGFANIWIVEPLVQEEITGIIMTQRSATTQGTGNEYFGFGFGEWTIRTKGRDIRNQNISEGLPLNAYTGQTGNNPFLTIHIANQETVDKYHGRKVTLSSVANVWIIEPTPLEHLQGHVVSKAINPSGSTSYIWKIRLVGQSIGEDLIYQRVYNDGAVQVAADANRMYGARVRKYGTDKWFVEVIDSI